MGMNRVFKSVKIAALVLAVLSVFFLCSFTEEDGDSELIELCYSNDVDTVFANSKKVYIGVVNKCEYVESNKAAVLTTAVKSVYKGNCISGQKLKIWLSNKDGVQRMGIEEGVLYLFMVSGAKADSNQYGAETLSKIIRIEKDKSIKQFDDVVFYSETEVMIDSWDPPPMGYDSLIRSVEEAQRAEGLFTVYTRPYIACFLIGLVITVICLLGKCRILLDNIITFFVSLAIIFTNSLSIETAAFYLDFGIIDWGDVIYNTVCPLAVLTAVSVVISLAVRLGISKNRAQFCLPRL